jgi:uncharacterized protein (DUF1697 family)
MKPQETSYIALLRGINVGGIRIKMADLKACVEGLGYADVKTFLQTGNVTFRTAFPRDEVHTALERTLTETFHYEAFVHLLDRDTVARVAAAYPFPRDEEHHAYVIFVSDPAVHAELTSILPTLGETLASGDQVVYWKVPKGQTLETPFAKLIGKAKYKRSTTNRNLNTVEEILG